MLTFLPSQIAKDLSAEMLDGVSTSVFLLKNNSDPIVITGFKKFAQTLSIDRAFELSDALNGYKLTELWDQALRIDGDQTLKGSLRVNGDLQATRYIHSCFSHV